MIDIDIDRLGEAAKQSRLFSVERLNLFSFRRKDHGPRKAVDLRTWADEHFESADVSLDGGAVRLVTFPRHLFYKFSPISLWLGHGPDGDLRGILYEVNNTFGETHTYIAKTPEAGRSQHAADKIFHVSPFFDVSGKYHFTFRQDAKKISLIIRTLDDGVETHLATIKLKAHPATSAALLKLALTKPFSTLGVTLGIHWQALKIFLKGAKYRAPPRPPEQESSLAIGDTINAPREPAA